MKLTLATLITFFLYINLSAQVGFQDNIIIDDSKSTDGAWKVFLADLDSDGDLDLLFAARFGNKIGWFENTDGQGNYSVSHILSDDADEANDVTAADIDNDGDLDVVAISFEDDKVVWFENNDGQGDFSSEKIISDNANNIFGPVSVYAIDVDIDGNLDIVTASFFDNQLAWIKNLDGQGNFGNPQSIDNSVTFARYAYPADLNGDGNQDLIGISSNNGTVVWYENISPSPLGPFNNGTGIITNANQPQTAFAADLDGDGDLDVVTASTGDDEVAWFENLDGQGDFGTQQIISNSLNGAEDVHAADLDGDGDMDILCTSDFDDELVWFENTNGQGSFSSEKLITNQLLGIRVVQTGDIDNDGDIDVVSASSEDDKIEWYENDGQGEFIATKIISAAADSPQSIAAMDIDGDGDLDVLSASSSDHKIAWYENASPQGVISQQNVISTSVIGAKAVVGADLDGDGDADVVAASPTNDEVVWFENLNGQGNFGSQQMITNLTDNVRGLTVADLDNDGDQDVVSVSSFDDKVAWYQNNGLGTFGSQNIISLNLSYTESVIAEDLDDDGDLDIIFTDRDNDRVVWHKNLDGQGNFGTETFITTDIDGPNTVVASDLDGDGDLDIAVSSAGEDKVVWYENTDGQGNFGLEKIVTISTTAITPTALVAADIDGDGDMDIGNGHSSTDEIVWYENLDGAGNFGTKQPISDIVDGGLKLIATDIDADGDVDLISAASINDNITWHENLSPTSNEILGQVLFDINGNGCDNQDPPMPNILVNTTDGTNDLGTVTIQNGIYQLFPGEGNFNTSLALPDFFEATPTSIASNFMGLGNMDTGDFCVQAIQNVDDLSISLYPKIDARPGFDVSYELVYKNNGSAPESNTISVEFDDTKLNFLNASMPITTPSSNTITFDFTDLNPFETRRVDLKFNVFSPPTVNIDEVLNFTATINPVMGDISEEDNVFTFNQTVIGSYDPNDIRVMEGETITIEEVENYLHYIIRFQNTGTASAINVRVENFLDSDLDIQTFQLESTSHDNRVEINNENQISFIFNDINLPDSTSNEPASNGFIAYRIKPKAGLTVGDLLSNRAEIFFDFNPPIETNTVITEIVEPVGIQNLETNKVALFPNPTTGIVDIATALEIAHIKIYNQQGQLQFIDFEKNQIDLSALASGVYFCKIDFDDGSSVMKKIFREW
ncbi:MAG: FG-GAP-like repeat-containing protein [Bacteroidota bacterium]